MTRRSHAWGTKRDPEPEDDRMDALATGLAMVVLFIVLIVLVGMLRS